MKTTRCALAVLVTACSTPAFAQGSQDQIIGSWSLVSLETDTADGRIQPFGPKPMGYVTFSADGHFSAQFMRPDLPRIAANSRLKATSEESIAIAMGLTAFFGEWKLVDAKTGELSLTVAGSSYPNWNGTTQKRFFKVDGSAMTLINPSSPSVGTSTVLFKRFP